MIINIKLLVLLVSIFLVSCEKSKYENYQNTELVAFMMGFTSKGIDSRCLVTSIPTDFPRATTVNDIQFYKIFSKKNFDLCNITNVNLSGYEAVFLASTSWCGMVQQKSNARSLNIKILVYIINTGMALPAYKKELDLAPAVVLLPIKRFEENLLHWNNAKMGILALKSPTDWGRRLTEIVTFSLVAVTILLTMGITIGFTKLILQGSDSFDSANMASVKYMVIILPITMIGMLLLLYFFYFIMVWFVIIMFYLMSAFCFSMIFMLFMEKGNYFPRLKKSFNRFGLKEIDYRFIILLIMGLVISTVWIVARKSIVGLVLNNVMGVYVCIEVAISLGVMFVVSKNFKVLLMILATVLIIDAVMVYVPLRNNAPNTSDQLALFPNPNMLARVKRSSGNSIMESVATAMGGTSNEEIPIRFKIPIFKFKNDSSSHKCYVTSNQYSLIGFGDLILPGAFIVYIMVFAVLSRSNVALYFSFTFLGYVIGLIFTYVAVSMTMKGQPALVFLLPCTVLPTLLLTVVRSDFNSLWHHTWFPGRLSPDFTGTEEFADQQDADIPKLLLSERQKPL